MDTDWPPLNSRAWLRLACCGAEHPTRIEGFTEKGCIVATPSLPHAKDVEPGVAAKGFFLGWVAVHHALELPVSLLEHTVTPLPMWTIEAVGDVQETQRRQFVRLMVDAEVELDLLQSGAPTRAQIVDLSEGGLKCFVDRWALDPGGRMFKVTLHLPDKTFVIPAQMAWWGNEQDDGQRPIGVRFEHESQAVADQIRSFIFARQLEERRRRLV